MSYKLWHCGGRGNNIFEKYNTHIKNSKFFKWRAGDGTLMDPNFSKSKYMSNGKESELLVDDQSVEKVFEYRYLGKVGHSEPDYLLERQAIQRTNSSDLCSMEELLDAQPYIQKRTKCFL